MKWIHHQGVRDFAAMSNLARPARAPGRDRRGAAAGGGVQHDSSDGTRKWLVRIGGGGLVETVLIPDGNRATLCVSSQVGCSLDCSFCSTGKQGFQRDLSAAEIIGQLWLAIESFDAFQSGKDRVVTNVVMMGMGEPLLNFDNVVAAMDLMMDDLRLRYLQAARDPEHLRRGAGPGSSWRGQRGEPRRFPARAERRAAQPLVPINRRYPIAELLDSARRYIEAQSDTKRVVTDRVHADGRRQRPARARPGTGGTAARLPVQDQPDSLQSLPQLGLRAPERQRRVALLAGAGRCGVRS
jgi:23S rRNA (adenine2503-C2)-methyltransferase